jgi:recombinational DNA repair protein RecR
VERNIKEIGFAGKITHLARGIPMGGELEYIDDETLQSALEGRK